MNVSLMKQPSAFLPIAMPLAALALVLGYVAIFGVVHETDEGADYRTGRGSHLFDRRPIRVEDALLLSAIS